jgi:primosomal protein N' (replication factor Y)
MEYFEAAPTRIVRAESAVFTYQSDLGLKPGHIVTIPIGKSSLPGLVIRKVKKPPYETRAVESIIEETHIPEASVNLALWISDYYHTHLATVLQTMLPRGLSTKRRLSTSTPQPLIRDRTKNVLNKEQRSALDTILAKPSGTFLLQGVTGSGKTEIYKKLADTSHENGRSIIILVPEIGLTRQVVDELASDLPDAILTHSKMTEAQRHIAWKQVLNADGPVTIIGPRSALFMPVKHLGAIVVDEAHEPSYKQEQAPRYSALRVASVLGAYCEARVIFGSATPLISDRFIAEAQGVPIIHMHERARKGALASVATLVDMTKRDGKKHPFLSAQLLEQIEQNIAAKQQTLLFHNRRGSAHTTLCESCGWTATCPRCFVPLILHSDNYHLSCHICSVSEKVPTSCPDCGAANIIHKGVGTKRIESELQRLFPKAAIARFDSDNTTDETVQSRYKELYDGDVDIIVGTQIVAKGLDLPHLKTVGVIQADSGLALPDFMATERTFQLLAQVIGRVGRDHRETSVIVQTYQPSHPVIQYGLTQDYEGFYYYALAERKKSGFPPYRHLLQLTTVYKTEAGAVRASRTLAAELRDKLQKDVEVLGPTPAFYERQRDTYRWQLILKSPVRQHLVDALAHVPATHWQTELDPASLL